MVLNPRSVEKYYDKEAYDWVQALDKEPNKYIYSTYFSRLLKNAQGKIALDLGCGAGTFSVKLAESGFGEVLALDISESMLSCLDDEAKKRKLNIKTMKGDVCNLNIESNSVDFIISVGLMECLNNQRKALSEIRRVLKPGGLASIRWVNRSGIWWTLERFKRAFGFPSGPFAVNGSRNEEIKDLVRESGLKLKRFKGMITLPLFMFPRPLPSFLSLIFLKTGFGYWFEKRNLGTSFYYSFLTELTK